jgi:glycosyltransferase involved in cell wall biosynthesis
VIGDGPLRTSLETFAKESKIRCQFRGIQPAAVIHEALQKAKVFCVPSVTAADGDSEGLGIVFAEAQAMGVPVVSTSHGGIPEIVLNSVTGLLVPERDSQALADALSLLLADEDLWQRFHHAARQHIEQHFDLKTQTAMLENIYNQAVTIH